MQSRRHSIVESVVNTAMGLVVALLATAYVLPVFGVVLTLRDNFVATAIMTIISVVRTYMVRRMFNARVRRSQ